MQEILSLNPPVSPARVDDAQRGTLRVALVQHRWHENPADTEAELEEGIKSAAKHGAKIVFLPELTLSKYPAFEVPEAGAADATAEDLMTGKTFGFAKKMAAAYQIHVHISLFRTAPGSDGLGLNTAIIVSPAGELVAATNKLHIPRTAGYYEDKYFREGPNEDPYPVHRVPELGDLAMGLPTCWDEWFSEPPRIYSLAGADLLAYPTAIGSEPDHPDFDTEPLWRQTIIGNGIANGLFMVVPNRWGNEGALEFYGSSFISDPYGRILARAPRDESAVLVAALDLDARRDWLTLFPFLRTRRPETYGAMTRQRNDSALGEQEEGAHA
ncbi:nitrilase-related carbon-nitrogen hydrolase [Glutamicibacter halophytocola]|uniref:nitrilase-related carbon-nitrogen hydrolase n=1 Tax=Glutamicibacter halophytocola TaxID=1933880 RepID=UPI0015C54724|nr:nitrilase-related carbon-nitrogen hydrolase [Glutamicibacter halophytocola]NQD40425.1 hydrolase [Glutamicibacter halophytocola]